MVTQDNEVQDNEYIDTIIKQYSNQIYNFAFRLTGNMADAEDLTQETFLKAYQKLWQLKLRLNPVPWLYRILINLNLDRVRRKKIKYADIDVSMLTDEQQYDNQQNSGKDCTENIELKERETLVMQALDKLKPEDRTMVILHGIEHKPYSEIAKILNCSVGTVKWRMFHVIRRLREMIKTA